jgi:hypothetical protein
MKWFENGSGKEETRGRALKRNKKGVRKNLGGFFEV